MNLKTQQYKLLIRKHTERKAGQKQVIDELWETSKGLMYMQLGAPETKKGQG